MQQVVRILTLVLAAMLVFQVLPAGGQTEQTKKEWTGTLAEGTLITKDGLLNGKQEGQVFILDTINFFFVLSIFFISFLSFSILCATRLLAWDTPDSLR